MKTLSLLAAAAALTALVALPVRLEIAGTVFLAAGLVALLRHDYRTRPVLKLPARRRKVWRPLFRAPALRVPAEAHRFAA